MQMTADVKVREFASGDEAAFRTLNEEWITDYFELEAKDRALFADPRGAILGLGGRIFLALRGDEIVGCCALLALRAGEYEVAKMTVAKNCRGLGIGRHLLEQTIEAAKQAGATRLYLETSRKLVPAIRLYESLGFEHLPPNRVIASPYARAEVYMELLLARGSSCNAEVCERTA